MAFRTIHNKGPYQTEEYDAGGTITPGMLCNINSSNQVIAHAVAEVQAVVMLAQEDALQGNEVSDNYTTSSKRVITIIPGKGSVVNCLVKSGERVAVGDYLCSAGDGTFIEVEAAASGSLNAGALVQVVDIDSRTMPLTANTLIACRVL